MQARQRRTPLRPTVARLAVVTATVVAALAAPHVHALMPRGTAPPARDPWLRPFSSTSIWNMPIGSEAVYVDAGLPLTDGVGLDAIILRQLAAHNPPRPLVRPGSWHHRCSGSVPTGVSLNIPDWMIVPDAAGASTPNNTAAFLLPDRRTLVNTNVVARCAEGGPIYGWQTGNPAIDRTDLYGDGRYGSHGASRLSGIGGAIRPGELTGDTPIQHALDLLVWATHLHYGTTGGYRWPAAAADSYAADRYHGTNPHLQMGSLLAIPPDLTADDLGITTAVGRKLFTAMQDYGGYVTDDAAWDATYLSVDDTAIGTFPWGDAEKDDMRRIIDHAAVVTNNTPDTIGGGGTPRQPLLPELTPPPEPPPASPPPGAGGATAGRAPSG